MKYDFTVIPDRSSCGSSKWNAVPGASVEKVPLSTADMEFPPAPEITQALKNLLDTTVLGYTGPTKDYFDAVCAWMKRRHGYEIDPKNIVSTPGVVYALSMVVEACTAPGDNIIIMSPVYYPFDMVALARGRNIVYSPLKLENGRYFIDYEDLEEKASRADCTALLFCNPHNPVGRVWLPEELEKVVDICDRHNVFIIDDEIHNDLIMPGHKHTVMATVSERARQICAVCTAPSKTFNLAGLQCSNIIIENQQVLSNAKAYHMSNMLMSLNIFAYTACQAAYNNCEDWLEQLISVVKSNADYITAFMAENFPEVKVYPLEGTYLLWVDFSAWGMTHFELETFMKEEAGLYLDEGYIFGKEGRGFERFNLACSPITIQKSMERLKSAIEKRRALWEKEGKPEHFTLEEGGKLEGFIYNSSEKSNLDLSKSGKPTIIVFSRYYTCSLCQAKLSELKALWPELESRGIDLKVVLQSTPESVREGAKEFPFEFVCDPEAKLYDRFNVFEADSISSLLAGDPFISQIGQSGVRKLIASSFSGAKTEGRQRQLSAVFAVAPDMTVKYAYYGKTLSDFPDINDAVKSLL